MTPSHTQTHIHTHTHTHTHTHIYIYIYIYMHDILLFSPLQLTNNHCRSHSRILKFKYTCHLSTCFSWEKFKLSVFLIRFFHFWWISLAKFVTFITYFFLLWLTFRPFNSLGMFQYSVQTIRPREGKLWIPTSGTPLKNWPCVTFSPWRRGWVNTCTNMYQFFSTSTFLHIPIHLPDTGQQDMGIHEIYSVMMCWLRFEFKVLSSWSIALSKRERLD